jgi:molybdate transport system substrate-binding protein
MTMRWSGGLRRRHGAWLGQVRALACVSLILIGCSGSGSSSATPPPVTGELTVAAAADLQVAFTEAGATFTERTGWRVTFSFGSTGNLTTQIEQGAPFDVLAAANVAFVDRLIDGGYGIEDSKRLYAVGRIVLASNRAAGVDVQTLDGLLDPSIRHIAIANPEHAPYGAAAREALSSAGLWEQIEPKLVYGENVRQTLQFVQTGNAEAGIVALSIADVPEISSVLIDDHLHNPLLQAMVAVSDRPHEAAAREFIAFITGEEGQAILLKYGFMSPPDT